MADEILQFVAVTATGKAFDIEFPLHPHTQSPAAVSALVTQLLATISEHAQQRPDVTDGDILQALAMTTAIRGRMLEDNQTTVAERNRLLQQQAWDAVSAAHSYPAGRA